MKKEHQVSNFQRTGTGQAIRAHRTSVLVQIDTVQTKRE